MTKPFYLLFIGLLLTSVASNLQANNIQVSNTELTGQNTTDGYTLVQFDLSWENSWRTSSAPNNWDAAWVFVKYRVAGGEWQHAWLSTTDSDHQIVTTNGVTATINVGTTDIAGTPRGMGAFMYRTNDGSGTNNWQNVQLRWNHGANGVADAATPDIKVFAIEMVYVPQGAFTVGSGGTESGSFTNGSWVSGATIALSISSENELAIGQSAGNLWGTSSTGNNTIGDPGTLPAAFPKGFAAFYCMKYSITQQQYVDFLNTLTQTQATARKMPKPSTNYRYQITGSVIGEYATINPYLACNYPSWMDGAAYSDWAGLRPMTELEFEKACRGTATPVANEYAWGTDAVAASAYTLSNNGQSNEGIANNYSTVANTGNASYSITVRDVIGGPLRVGIFAGHTSNTGRITAGASYYGIMELSGNLWERTVTVGNADGRAFTGEHGDGTLSANGHATETEWPGLNNGEVTGATGSGYRGGSWGAVATYMRVSDRFIAARTNDIRGNTAGFRAVRLAPVADGPL